MEGSHIVVHFHIRVQIKICPLISRSVCGRRVRVELSSGRSRSSRGFNGPSRRGRPFHPEDRCYECGDRGHYAR
jgi:splicing factor, arginine/serine-rich 7